MMRQEGGQRSLHDGSVNDRFDVVLPVSRVDDTLPFGVLLDVALRKQLKAHVWGHRLRTEQQKKGWGAVFLQWRFNLKFLKTVSVKPLKAELDRCRVVPICLTQNEKLSYSHAKASTNFRRGSVSLPPLCNHATVTSGGQQFTWNVCFSPPSTSINSCAHLPSYLWHSEIC